MIPNFKYYQPIILGDIVEYNRANYLVVGVDKVERTTHRLTLFLLLETEESYFNAFNNPIICEVCLIKSTNEIFSVYQNNGANSILKFKKRLFKNTSDIVCKFVCPYEFIKPDKKLCSLCDLCKKIKPSDYFFISDEVMSFLVVDESRTVFKGRGVGFITGQYINYNDIRNLKTVLEFHYYNDFEYIRDCAAKFKSVSQDLVRYLDSIYYRVSPEKSTGSNDDIIVSSKKYLRLRNRHGFTCDINNEFCKNCITSNCFSCDYKQFIEKSKQSINYLI